MLLPTHVYTNHITVSQLGLRPHTPSRSQPPPPSKPRALIPSSYNLILIIKRALNFDKYFNTNIYLAMYRFQGIAFVCKNKELVHTCHKHLQNICC